MSPQPSSLLSTNLARLRATDALTAFEVPEDANVRINGQSGQPEVFLRSGGRAWVRLHSLRDPHGEAAQWLETLLPSSEPVPSVLCIVGLGAGYILDVLDARGARPHVIVFEPEPALLSACLGRRSLDAWLSEGRLSLVLGPEFRGARDACRRLPDVLDDPLVLVHPVLARERGPQVARALDAVKQALFEVRANANARATFAAPYLLNSLRNLSRFEREADVSRLRGQFSGVPAILVGAGPSLDQHLFQLRACAGRGLVIAVDTAVRPLLTAHIEPDFVVSVDPAETHGRHLCDLPPCPRTHLVAEGSVSPAALKSFHGRTWFFRVANHQPWPWFQSFGVDCGRLRAWGSVMTTAFDLAIEGGCDPIIFLGADFSFSRDRVYCGHTTFEVASPDSPDEWASSALARWPHHVVMDIHREPVRTTPHLVAFRDWIVDETVRHPRTFINASGAGILHGGHLRQQRLLDAAPRTAAALVAHARHHLSTLHPPVRATLGPLRHAAADLLLSLDETDRSEPPPVILEWQHFAPGLSTDRVGAALHDALTPGRDGAASAGLGAALTGSAAVVLDALTKRGRPAAPPDTGAADGDRRKLARFRDVCREFGVDIDGPPRGPLIAPGRPELTYPDPIDLVTLARLVADREPPRLICADESTGFLTALVIAHAPAHAIVIRTGLTPSALSRSRKPLDRADLVLLSTGEGRSLDELVTWGLSHLTENGVLVIADVTTADRHVRTALQTLALRDERIQVDKGYYERPNARLIVMRRAPERDADGRPTRALAARSGPRSGPLRDEGLNDLASLLVRTTGCPSPRVLVLTDEDTDWKTPLARSGAKVDTLDLRLERPLTGADADDAPSLAPLQWFFQDPYDLCLCVLDAGALPTPWLDALTDLLARRSPLLAVMTTREQESSGRLRDRWITCLLNRGFLLSHTLRQTPGIHADTLALLDTVDLLLAFNVTEGDVVARPGAPSAPVALCGPAVGASRPSLVGGTVTARETLRLAHERRVWGTEPGVYRPGCATHFVLFALPPDGITHAGGHAYAFTFRTLGARLYTQTGWYRDSILEEDGLPLPSPHASEDRVARDGHGAYTLWSNTIVFSTSDGSDPRSNGRRYTLRVPPHVLLLESLPTEIAERLAL